MAVVNPFGRVDSEVYLKDELIEGQRIEFNNNLHKGIGIVRGIACEGVPLLGKTYIIELESITDMKGVEISVNYSNLAMQEFFINPIKN